MTDRKDLRGVILSEDKRQERFLRHLLGELGFDRRKFRFESAPAGEGAAEAWVRKRYPQEVEYIRSKNYQQLALIAMRDGDNVGVDGRKAELDDELRSDGQEPRSQQELFVTPVPTWSIETWLLALVGDNVSGEHESLKEQFEHRFRRLEKITLRKAAKNWQNNPDGGSDLGSLVDGRLELKRIM